jgi:hypothetical protein
MIQSETMNIAQSNPSFNRFRFKDACGTTQIVFLTQAPGPVQPDDPLGASQLEYEGPEGQFTFRGNEITKEASRLGRLVTVTLRSNAADAGQLDLTLVFPPLKFGDEKQLRFQTIAINSQGPGFVPADQTGALLTYEVLNLEGIADSIIIAI